MEMLGTLISVISIIVAIIHKVSESSSGSNNHVSSYTDKTYEVVHEFTPQEKLDNMNIDSLNICYTTGGVGGFSIANAQRTLLNKYNGTDFYIDDVIVRQNCMYIKVMHSIPFKGTNKCFGAAFSINFMTVNNGISVCGSKKINADETEVYKEISEELLKAVS